jgi:putative ABC transport system ATP-binding protein
MATDTPENLLVSLRGISKHFGEGETRIDALRDISLDVVPGEVVALRGPSGSGKTTLLNVIACILDPSGGRMSLDGEVVYDNKWLRSDLRRLRLEKIGFIFQFHNLLPFLNATDNVAIVLQLAGLEPAEAQKRSSELLDYLEVGHRKRAFPAKLSGGEAQRVAIARARQPSAHHPGRRANRRARFQARADRHGPLAQAGPRSECGGDCGHSRREDFRSLRPHVLAARRPAGGHRASAGSGIVERRAGSYRWQGG